MFTLGLITAGLAYAGYRVAKSSRTSSYGSSLEQYITDGNPQHSGDVERLTAEYNLKVSRGLL
jgi:hypothetical protein